MPRPRVVPSVALLGLGLAVVIGMVLGSALQPEEAEAGGSFFVSNPGDQGDANPGDGACDIFGGGIMAAGGIMIVGPCTLRAAIEEANALPGPAVVTLPEGTYRLTLSEAGDPGGGPLEILAAGGKITVNGAGAASTFIEGVDRLVFFVLNDAELALNGVTIQNSSPATPSPNTTAFGGGLNNRGTLTVTDSVIRDNDAEDGAGLANVGSATLTRTTVSGNTATEGAGGGIYNAGGELMLVDSTVSGNTQLGSGSGPDGRTGGGGIYSDGGSVSLTNTTVSGNNASFAGAGAKIEGVAPLLTVVNSTIAGNVAGMGVGGINRVAGTVTLKNTIVAGNGGPDCSGAMTSFGHNIDSDGTCGLGTLGDQPGVDPLLGPLGDNGGPTRTQELLAGSPAIDAGDDGAAPATDQRGAPRVEQSDIGAFEYQGVVGVDGDGDGFDSEVTGGTDCDDADPSVFPGAPEVPGDGTDQDCDGVDLMEEEEKEEPPPKKEEQPPEEEAKPPPDEEEEKPTGGDLVLMGGGEFVFWEFIPVLAKDVFGTVKIAWFWNPFEREWTSYVPVLGVVNFLVSPRDFLWVVSEGPQTIVVG